MKILMVLIALVLAGCSTPISRVQTKIICQDYANAWCRNAIEHGLEAGVLWYKDTATGDGHAVCWFIDPESKEVKYVEPQTRSIIKNPLHKESVYQTYWNNKPGFNDMDIRGRKLRASLGINEDGY